MTKISRWHPNQIEYSRIFSNIFIFLQLSVIGHFKFYFCTFRYLYPLSVPHTIVSIDLTPDKPSKKKLGEFIIEATVLGETNRCIPKVRIVKKSKNSQKARWICEILHIFLFVYLATYMFGSIKTN